MKSFTKISILLIALLCIVSCDRIEGNFNFPVLFKYATKATGNTQLELRFQLPAKSNSNATSGGITFGQFIGVRFQAGLFDFSSNLSPRVTLASASTTFNVAFVPPVISSITATNTADGNVLYVQYIDKNVLVLPARTNLVLTINFPAALSQTFVHNIGIFTSTSNNRDQVIIDNLPSLGNFGLYRDYTLDDNNKILIINNSGSTLSTIVSPAQVAGNTTLYPGFTININFRVELQQYWIFNAQDMIMHFKYATKSFSYPTSVTTSAFSSAANEGALTESLSLIEVSDGIIVSGFVNNLVFPRKFIMSLNGVKTTDIDIGLSTNLECQIFYRNTYSIVSYSRIAMDVIKVIPLQEAKVFHPDYFPIFDGMGWPFQFQFRSNVEITTGGYVVIRQRDWSKTTQSVTLVASSCDFSLTNLEQNFGKRFNCLPLRNDFSYEVVPDTSEANGIYFRIPTIISSTTDTYKIRVWGFVERCFNTNNATESFYRELTFTIRIFKNAGINDTYKNESIFPITNQSSTTNYVLAESTSVKHLSRCYPLTLRSKNAAITSDAKATQNMFQLVPTCDGSLTDTAPCNSSDNLHPIGIEVYNIHILGVPSSLTTLTTLGNTTHFAKYALANGSIVTPNTGFTEKYIFSTTSDIANTSVFFYALIPTKHAATMDAYSLVDYIPSECLNSTKDAGASLFTTGFTNVEPFYRWIFNRQWFSIGNMNFTGTAEGCQLNWEFYSDTVNSTKLTTTLIFMNGMRSAADASTPTANEGRRTTMVTKEISATQGSTTTATITRTANISSDNSTRISSVSTENEIFFRITSTKQTYDTTPPTHLSMWGGTCKATHVLDQDAGPADIAITNATNRLPFAFYTDCIKWSSKPSNSTWLFTYFDVQLQLINKNINPLRVIRFIKLYPEMGVFQDPIVNDSDTATSSATLIDYQKWINIHLTPTWSGSTPFNVCLIEITSNIIDKTKQNSSSVLIMWLFATSLLDLDPSNETFEYPVAPLPSATAYGNNSGQTISANFRRIGDSTVTSKYTFPLMGVKAAEAGSLRSISELEMVFYKIIFHASANNTTGSQAANPLNTFEFRRTTYHIFMGSVIYIPTTNNPSGSTTANLFVPILCPNYSNSAVDGTTYPTNGIYFVNPIATLAWAQMSAYNNISKIDTYVRPVSRVNTDIVKNTDEYGAAASWSFISNGSGTTIPYPVSNLLTRSPVQNGAHLFDENGNPRSAVDPTTAALFPGTRKASFSDLKVNFRAYTKVTNNEQNILDLTTITDSSTSSIAIFLSAKIGDISSSGVTGNPNIAGNLDKTFKYKKTNNQFYILGQPFNKFLAWGYENPNGVMMRETAAAGGSNFLFTMSKNHVIPITGIPRLDISNYENSDVKKTNYFNYVAVFTASNHGFNGTTSPLNRIQSNLVLNESSGALATFIGFKLYLPNLDDTTSWNPQIREDDTDNFITNEKSANINVSGTFPTTIPRGTYVKLSFDNSIISTVSKCGLVENGRANVVTECEISSSDVSCPFTKNATTFEICCYNINNDNSKITVDRAEVNFNLTLTGFSSSSYMDSTEGSKQTSDVFYKRPSASEITASAKFSQLVFTNRIVTDLSSANANFFSTLTTLRYYLSSTVNGIGLAHFILRLPRSATRGMTLSLITNLASLKPSTLRTRILPTFGNSLLYGSNFDNGDAFIDSVYSDFSTNGIILKLKNMVYKCNIKLSNTLNLFVWPVFTPNLTNHTVKITLKGADNSDMANSNNHNVTSTPTLSLNLVEENTLLDFCKISNVDPRIPSSYAEYTFTFSFQQTSSKIEAAGVTGNEILIFFDYIFYGDDQDVICYNENNLLQCSFIEDSILSIRFNNINTSGDSTQVIRIVGIKNPHIPTNNNGVFFGCAMASTNFITNTRRYMIKGVASIVEGIDPKNETTYGNIVYKNNGIFHRINIPNSNQATTGVIEGSAQGEEPLNPMESPNLLIPTWENSYTISFSLDVANRIISTWENGFTLGNGVEIYITLPDEFKLHYYSLSNIRATIIGFRMNELNQSLIEMVNFDSVNSTSAETSLKVTEIKVVGNQLRLKLNLANLVFNKFFQYFQLKLFNIPPPENNTSDTSTGKITTKAIELIMMNTARTQIFKTWSNLNNWSQHDVLVNKINDFLPRNKGLKFEYDQKKWVIDTIDKSGSSIILNELLINSGRYATYHFRVRNTTRLLEPKVANVILLSNRLRFDKTMIEVSTYRFSDIPFKIGIPCNENPGYMISKPIIQTVPNENIFNFFMPIANVVIRIMNDSTALVMSPNNIDVRINGSTFVDFTVLEAPVEDININFLASSQSEILNSRLLANTLKIRTLFRMLDKQTDTQQSFNLPILDNNCYTFKEDKIVFAINKVAAIIPNSALKNEMFTYLNSETESTISPNAIAFRFNSVYSQIYMYAVLTCYDYEFPTIEQMKNNNITQSETLRFYYEILNNEGTHLITFKNVLRGYPMKMRVFIESTQGILSERTASDNIVILNSTLTNGTVTPIIATRTRNPRCASYQFKTRPGLQVTNPLLWYWQRRFSLSGYYESGCITAVDQYGTEIPGLPVIKNETNCGTSRCRFIDRPSFIVNATQLAIPETYTICAYPLSYCETEPTNYQETFNEIMITLSNNQTFNNTLNTRVVPEFVLVEVDDNLRPENPTISNIQTTTNSLSFSTTSNRPIRCFSRLSNQGAPTDAEFNTCSSNNCKVLEISKISSSYTFSGLSAGSYTIYAKCYNDMHCSQSSTGVISLGSGTVSTPSNNNNNNTNNNTNPIFSKLIKISMLLIFIIFLLLE